MSRKPRLTVFVALVTMLCAGALFALTGCAPQEDGSDARATLAHELDALKAADGDLAPYVEKTFDLKALSELGVNEQSFIKNYVSALDYNIEIVSAATTEVQAEVTLTVKGTAALETALKHAQAKLESNPNLDSMTIEEREKLADQLFLAALEETIPVKAAPVTVTVTKKSAALWEIEDIFLEQLERSISAT